MVDVSTCFILTFQSTSSGTTRQQKTGCWRSIMTILASTESIMKTTCGLTSVSSFRLTTRYSWPQISIVHDCVACCVKALLLLYFFFFLGKFFATSAYLLLSVAVHTQICLVRSVNWGCDFYIFHNYSSLFLNILL